MTTFEAGKTYYGRFATNYDSIIKITVAKRTAKTITTTEGKRLGIKVWQDCENVMPLGRYSMAPTIGADRSV